MHYFVHMLNDFSGSPRIIGTKIECYRSRGADCKVISSAGPGFIAMDAGPHHIVSYAKHRSKLVWAMRLLWWHIRTFLYLLVQVRRGDIVHCSTLLTAPHLLAGRLKRAKTVLHIMETEVNPRLHKAVLLSFARSWAHRVIYLSAYVETSFKQQFEGKPSRITYPCIDPAIEADARAATVSVLDPKRFTVGLVCSMIWHKGYAEFVSLARRCPDIYFLLVLNGQQSAFEAEFPVAVQPANLSVRFNVKRIGTAIDDMDVLLSLTNRAGWIETFGLTLIEAMCFGRPVIAPDIGAPKEYIEHCVSGYLIDESDLDQLAILLEKIRSNPDDYDKMSAAARRVAERFSYRQFQINVGAEKIFAEA